MKHKTFYLFILLIFRFLAGFAQTEYIITVDPTTGEYSKIDSIDGVKFIIGTPNYLSFDSNNNRYIFGGIDNFGTKRLYCIDATNGNIISNPPYPVLSEVLDNCMELHYDNSSNMLFGLHWDNSESKRYFVSVNLNNGTYNIIDSLPGVKNVVTGPHYTTFNENQDTYIFKGGDGNGNYFLYSVDANTGSVLSNPSFPLLADPLDNVIALHFDNSTNNLYALHYDKSENREYIVTVNPQNGTHTIIDSLPGVKGVFTSPHYTTFDELNHHYTFYGKDSDEIKRLYTVDVTTGNIVSSPQFPILNNTLDNITELQYNNLTGTLYALHWEVYTTPSSIGTMAKQATKLYQNIPNPFNEKTIIKYFLPLDCGHAQIKISDDKGNPVNIIDVTPNGERQITVNCEALPEGIYTYSIIVEGKAIETKKLVKIQQ